MFGIGSISCMFHSIHFERSASLPSIFHEVPAPIVATIFPCRVFFDTQNKMAVVVTQTTQQRQWATSLCDCCGAPMGCGGCCYVMFCSCCAAGDIAKAAGRDYCMSCFIIPFCVGIIAPCWWSYDRQALAQRLNIVDPFSGSACLMFMCGCGSCLMCQELNTVRKYTLDGTLNGAMGATTTTVIMAASPQPVVMQQAAPVYGAPAGYA